MAIQIPSELTGWFREKLASKTFEQEERDYKWVVHLMLGRLLNDPFISSSEFPQLLVGLVGNELHPDDLKLSEPDADFVGAWLVSNTWGVRRALFNLCGGARGVAQWSWLPVAVGYGLGEELQDAFRHLVHGVKALDVRIDEFREAIIEVQIELRNRGGFKPEWRLLKPSHPFIGVVLCAADPEQYTLYHAGSLQRAIEDLGGVWPRITGGQRYATACELVREVHQALKSANVNVRDLIDTQSLLYLHGRKLEKEEPPEVDPGKSVVREPAPRDRSLQDSLLWSEERTQLVIRLARRGKPLLFAGPPGTGKTHVARALARELAVDDDHIEVVQFHPSYAYEDFIEGIRPLIGDREGTIQYEIRSGVLKQLAEAARKDRESIFVLIIDELNRANLPRVLGEVLYCIEYRGKDGEIQLPYSGEPFSLPENVLIIGTMNTADRSIALVDAALRRRFLELEFPPDPDVLRRWWKKEGNPAQGEEAAARLERLNAELVNRLDAHRLIGHTYLMDRHVADEGFENVWDRQLKPVLQEHLHAHPDDVEQLRETFLGE